MGVALSVPVRGPQVQDVTHPVYLRPEVLRIVPVHVGLKRNPLGNFNPMFGEALNLLWVVGQEASGRHTQVIEDSCSDGIVSLVGSVPKNPVGLDGVVPVVLEVVGTELTEKTDPTSLLTQIKKDPSAVFCNPSHRSVELLPTVTTQRPKDITGKALRVNAYQHILPIRDIPTYECQVILVVLAVFVQRERELAVYSGNSSTRQPFDGGNLHIRVHEPRSE